MSSDKGSALRSLLDQARGIGANSEELSRIADRFMVSECPVHYAYERHGVDCPSCRTLVASPRLVSIVGAK